VAKSSQSFEALPEAPTGMTFNQGVKRLDNILICYRSRNRNSIVGRTGKPDTATTSLHGQSMLNNEIDCSVPLLERP
jgi:hypothetical protein